MDLFDRMSLEPHNLLPKDGVVRYYGPIVPRALADIHLNRLMREIAWQHDELVLFGKKITTKRKVAWYANEPYSYTYSNATKTALPWSPILLELKGLVERASKEEYNSCLLNLYHDGSEGMTWHSDAEIDLKKNGAIASLSFGAPRKFSFKHKHTKQTASKILEHGSLLVMKEQTQTHWLHQLPKSKAVTAPRVNLTFRNIIKQRK